MLVTVVTVHAQEKVDLSDHVKALGSSDIEQRLDAIIALGQMGEQALDVMPELSRAAVQDSQGAVRVSAVWAMREIDESGAVAMMRRALSAQDCTVRARAAEALYDFGPAAKDAVPDLMVMAQDTACSGETTYECTDETIIYTDIRILAIKALGAMGRDAVQATPVLTLLILEETDETLTGAAEQAREAVDPRGDKLVSDLVFVLENADADLRYKAAWRLGLEERAARDAVPALTSALSDNDASVRAAAAEALGRIGPAASDAIPDLERTMRFDSGYARIHAAVALVRAGSNTGNVLPALMAELRTDDVVSYKKEAAWALGELGPDAADAVPALIEALGCDFVSVRTASAVALGKIGPSAEQALAALVERAVNDHEEQVRIQAGRSLAGISPEKAVALLAPFIGREQDAYMRKRAMEAMGRLGADAADIAVPELVTLLDQDKNRDLRALAAHALGMMGPAAVAAVPHLINVFRDMHCPGECNMRFARYDEEYIKVHIEAVNALGRIGPEAVDAVPYLTSLILETEFDSLSQAASEAVVQIDPLVQHVVPALIMSLKSQRRDTRLNAAVALRKLIPKARTAVPALIHVLSDPDEEVRLAAAETLGTIGSPAGAASKALMEMMNETSPPQRMAAATALGNIFAAEPPHEIKCGLLKTAQDENYYVSEAAVQALITMGSNPNTVDQDIQYCKKQ